MCRRGIEFEGGELLHRLGVFVIQLLTLMSFEEAMCAMSLY